MGHKSTLTFLSCLAVIITACYSEEKPIDTEPDPDIGEPPAFRQLCKNHLDFLEGHTEGLEETNALRLAQTSGNLVLENGNFDESEMAANTFSINSDPLYIYSGEGSAKVTDGSFIASVQEQKHFSSRDLESLNFWLYSANDEPTEFYVFAHGTMLDRVDGNDGYGYSGHLQESQQLVTVEPHSWTEVTLEFEPSQECLTAITIETFGADDTEFYVDQIEISAQLTEAE